VRVVDESCVDLTDADKFWELPVDVLESMQEQKRIEALANAAKPLANIRYRRAAANNAAAANNQLGEVVNNHEDDDDANPNDRVMDEKQVRKPMPSKKRKRKPPSQKEKKKEKKKKVTDAKKSVKKGDLVVVHSLYPAGDGMSDLTGMLVAFVYDYLTYLCLLIRHAYIVRRCWCV
jgi:hypothetical protein